MSHGSGRWSAVLSVLSLGALLTSQLGCARPFRAERHPAPAASRGCLLVLLPGLGDRPEDFARHGFVAEARRAGVACDLVALDARFGDYIRGRVPERVHEDVVAPARRAGYKQIWIAGVSMGGAGGLLTAWQHPGSIDGLILIAPYAGRPRDLRTIAEAGGPRRWRPPEDEATWTLSLWRWLATAGAPGSTVPPIYLAYGADDRDTGKAMLSELVPPERLIVRPGEHEWTVWEPLWADLLARAPLPRAQGLALVDAAAGTAVADAP